jgi:peroxiredoxin (alkyl hydroperoxide reductase subunit C)
MPLVGKKAPDFTATAVVGDDFVDYTLSSNWTGKQPRYTLLFFYPLDFTFVCPTEIIAFSDRLAEFRERGVQVVGVSIDSKYTHLAWKGTPRQEGGIGAIGYPLVADVKREACAAYDVLAEDGTAYRGLFLIDREGIVRHALVNDHPLGRSIDEAIRVVDALQHHERHGEVCPADWKPGEMAMKEDPVESKVYFQAKGGSGGANGKDGHAPVPVKPGKAAAKGKKSW